VTGKVIAKDKARRRVSLPRSKGKESSIRYEFCPYAAKDRGEALRGSIKEKIT